jgi:acyl dehydratase
MSELDDASEGEELPEVARVVTAADVKAYADAGGDQNPLHQDEAFARSVGFDGIIAHGMFTMGHMAAAIATWAGDGAVVERISVQFRAPVPMGARIVAGGRVRSIDRGASTVTLDTWVRMDREGGPEWPIRKGEAVVRLTSH